MEVKNQNVDLDAQAFPKDNSAEEPEGLAIREAEKKEEAIVESKEEDKGRIPYSRFENVNRARREAEAEAEKWRQRAIELEENRFSKETETKEVPAYWLKLYGDTEQTREGWKLWQENENRILAQAEERAVSRLEQERRQETESYQENLSNLDDHLETVASMKGSPLTEQEESAVLDIIDEYTAKDDMGNYLGAILPPDKAWEIYELKNQTAKRQTRQSRDSVANVISAPSQGEPSAERVERDKNFQPGNWGNWQNRFKGE